ncbi:MAG: FHA domain-containing protein [Rhodothermales bacterium]|nr:FHA domain-containing protein [Rhodothermales bacterium]MBO6781002.1 FHA domain-containing protein [Rhodothermales bacterium]
MEIQLEITGDSGSRRITTDQFPYRIGRDSQNDLILEGATHDLVSAHHAELRSDGKQIVLHDLQSTNGSWVDGKRVQGSAVIRSGASVELGKRGGTTITVRIPGATDATRIAAQPTVIATSAADELLLDFSSGSLRGRQTTIAGDAVLGRDPSCDVVFDPNRDSAASARHAEIRVRGGQHWIRDLGSTNGTFVNGRRVEEKQLRSGDVIEFGQGGPTARVSSGAASAVAETVVASSPSARDVGATRVADRNPSRPDIGSSPGQGTIQMWIDRAVEQARQNPATVFFERVADEAAGRSKKTARLYSVSVFGVLLLGLVAVAVINWRGLQGLEARFASQISEVRGELELQEGILQNNVDNLTARLDDVAGGMVDTTMFQEALEAERTRLAAVRSQIRKLNEQAASATPEAAAAAAGFQAAAQSVEASLFMLAVRRGGELIPMCTAFAVGSDGTLLTNAHCVEGASGLPLVAVKSGSRRGKEYEVFASEIHPAYNPNRGGAFDLALLRLETHGDAFTAMALASAEELEGIGPGYQIAVYGFPGEVMNLNRPNATYLPGAVTRLSAGGTTMLHSATTSRGTSGAPVLNDRGQLVGVNSFGTPSSQRAEVVVARDESGAVIIGPDMQPVTTMRRAPVAAAFGAVHGRYVREWLQGKIAAGAQQAE